jgi:multisubunit Na+/H+ antiporter MnhB subunit
LTSIEHGPKTGCKLPGHCWFRSSSALGRAGFVFRAIQILIYAAAGLLFAQVSKADLNYQTLMRLAAVALTPVLVLNLILEFCLSESPDGGLSGL